MKVLVAVKRVCDPYARVRPASDGKSIAFEGVKMAVNPFCENALEQAVAWREQDVASEAIAFSAGGPDTAETLRMALARGADRAIHVVTDKPPEPLAVAKIIAALAEREKPEVILAGKQAIDDDSNQTAQMAAALLGWGQALFLSEISIEDGFAVAACEVDGGIERLRVKLPCVLSADLRLNEPRHVSLPNIVKARKKPFETMAASDLGIDTAARIEVEQLYEPPERAGGIAVDSAEDLISKLRSSGALP